MPRGSRGCTFVYLYIRMSARAHTESPGIKLAADYFAGYTREKRDTSSTRYHETSSRKIRAAN